MPFCSQQLLFDFTVIPSLLLKRPTFWNVHTKKAVSMWFWVIWFTLWKWARALLTITPCIISRINVSSCCWCLHLSSLVSHYLPVLIHTPLQDYTSRGMKHHSCCRWRLSLFLSSPTQQMPYFVFLNIIQVYTNGNICCMDLLVDTLWDDNFSLWGLIAFSLPLTCFPISVDFFPLIFSLSHPAALLMTVFGVIFTQDVITLLAICSSFITWLLFLQLLLLFLPPWPFAIT